MDVISSLVPALLAGILAGAIVAFPLGPMGQLAARLTLEKHRRAARQVALTCLCIDSTAAATVLLALGWLPPLAFGWHPLVLAGVGAALVVLGINLWSTAHLIKPGSLPLNFKQPWQIAAVYTLLHPGALLTFTAAFGILHAHGIFAFGWPDKAACWLGVTFGVAAMWAGWLFIIHGLKQNLCALMMRQIFAKGLAVAVGFGGLVLVWESQLLQPLLK